MHRRSPNLPSLLSNFNGGVAAEFVNEKFKPAPWIRLIAGVRQTTFRSSWAENATDARFGIAVKLPQIDWLVRGFYGYYYPAPPLATAIGALLGLAASNNLSFAALHVSSLRNRMTYPRRV